MNKSDYLYYLQYLMETPLDDAKVEKQIRYFADANHKNDFRLRTDAINKTLRPYRTIHLVY